MKKECTRCHKELDADLFGMDNSRPDKLTTRCKDCLRKVRRQSYKKYRAKHLAYNRKWKKDHPEKVRTYRKGDTWKHQHPIKSLYHDLKYRSKKRGRDICTQQEFIVWYHSHDHRQCHYCGCSEQTQIDDTQTAARRLEIDRKDTTGGYTLDNIVLACSRCNLAKAHYWDYTTFKNYIAPAIKVARQQII
jgi:hypothetical protein